MILRKLSFCAIISTACFFSACSNETDETSTPETSPAETTVEEVVEKVAPKPAEKKQENVVTLHIKNGHLSKVLLAIDEKATDGYDRGLDDMAPPPGMETGYTALVSPDKQMYLYRDSRKPAKEIEWIFYGKVHKDKVITVSWDKTKLPADYNFDLVQGDKTLKMNEVDSVQIDKTDAIIITAVKK